MRQIVSPQIAQHQAVSERHALGGKGVTLCYGLGHWSSRRMRNFGEPRHYDLWGDKEILRACEIGFVADI